MDKKHSPGGESSGISLLEVMIAIGLMGLLALGLAEIFRQQVYVQGNLQDRGNLEDIRNVVRSSVKCELPCATNLARIPVNQGRWTLTPACDDTGLKVQVTDSKGKLPPAPGNLFKVNNGYICMYLPDPTDAAELPEVSLMPGVVPE
jgi:type II secretory pathway pseudopilin PulG